MALARSLQRAQDDADRPVTVLPSDTPTAVPAPAPLPEDFSGMVTIAPELTAEPSPRRPRHVALGAAVLVLVGAFAGAVALRDGDQTPATTTTSSLPTSPGGTGRAPQILYQSADFAGPEWPARDSSNVRAGVVDGEFHVSTRLMWTALVWKPNGIRRFSVSAAARITSADVGHLSIYCGAPTLANDRFLQGIVRTDGSWEITANDRVLATGATPQRAHELREAFVLRLDCITDTSPSRAVLTLNDVVLGTGIGTGSFPPTAVYLDALNKGAEPLELVINSVTIRPLD